MGSNNGGFATKSAWIYSLIQSGKSDAEILAIVPTTPAYIFEIRHRWLPPAHSNWIDRRIKKEKCDRAPSKSESGWTVDRIAEIKKLWAEGWSATQIAAKIGGVTRNAVLSKIHREGCAERELGHKRTMTVPRIRRPQTRPRAIVAKKRTMASIMASLPPSPLPEAAIDDVARKTLIDLERADCRWPVGHPGEPGFGFCALEAVAGLSYCAEHARRAYAPPPPRKQPTTPDQNQKQQKERELETT